jgi:hypothetical protein
MKMVSQHTVMFALVAVLVGAQPAGAMCTPGEERQPVLNLFRAWERLDPSLYGEQWTADAVQYYGRGKQRIRAKIISDRREFMAKLASVTTNDLQLAIVEQSGGYARFRASYDMHYVYKTGRVLSDTNDEIYVVVCDAGQWKIRLNDDRK